MGTVNAFKANIIEISKKALLIEYTGNKRNINAIEDLLSICGILEIVKSGKVACKSTLSEYIPGTG